MKRIVAITGGIGSGKSVVCHALSVMGYAVYDCDSEAKALMDSSTDIKQRIAAEISPDAINADGSICRPRLSAIVFSAPDKLKTLNSIVHSAVRNHCISWIESQNNGTLFIETAILYESRFDSLVTEIWEVSAPRELRISRVIERSKLSRREIEKRIDAQCKSINPAHKQIVNDGITPVIPRLSQLLYNNESTGI